MENITNMENIFAGKDMSIHELALEGDFQVNDILSFRNVEKNVILEILNFLHWYWRGGKNVYT